MANLKRVNDWFRAAADVEANTPITVGAALFGPAGPVADRSETEGEWLALAKLIELRRRQCRLSPEDLASRAAVALEEVVRIERAEAMPPEPCTVQRIALVLQLPEHRLLQLAGLVRAKDHRFREATVRFAARAEPLEELRPEELRALEEYVQVLAEA